MLDIVVAPDPLLATRLAHALDHRIVVERVRQDQAIRNELGNRRNAGLVRYITGCEDERRFLAVQIGKLTLQRNQRVVGSGDIASAAGSGADARRRRHHRADHLRVLSHAEIVVRAPDHDLAPAGWRMPDRVRETAGDPLEVCEHSIALLFSQAPQRRSKERVVIHFSCLDVSVEHSAGVRWTVGEVCRSAIAICTTVAPSGYKSSCPASGSAEYAIARRTSLDGNCRKQRGFARLRSARGLIPPRDINSRACSQRLFIARIFESPTKYRRDNPNIRRAKRAYGCAKLLRQLD